ncbi:hypothetical protein MLD38_031153 [Melastoma candidum]|uniref:Uncharacterized protein n=1 Tax=Melastoma candidum TaxID=119954 RepID=A0ACB9MSC9_9MYRT|nr:hypothetical protein MLD38_031153 [Melastoma candidum]
MATGKDLPTPAPPQPTPWPDLPKELWASIGNRLDTRIDITRFRGVCSAWRSLLSPPLSSNSPQFPLRIPLSRRTSANLARFTVYRLQPSFSCTNPPASPPEGWLIKVDERNPASIRPINPLSSLPIHCKRSSFPKVLSLMGIRVTEVCKEYVVESDPGETRADISSLAKVVLCPDSLCCDENDCVAFAVTRNGSLMYWRYGDDRWRDSAEKGNRYDDIVIGDGQVYVVDRLGTVYWVDPYCRMVQFSPPMCGGGTKKHLLLVCGDICVVDRYDQENCHNPNCYAEVAHFKVYRLDQEWGKWDEVKDLEDLVVFIGENSSFCVSVKEFSGCIGNCIYFIEQRGGLRLPKVYVFNMRDHSIKRVISIPDYWKILWPPPSWITPTPCLGDPNSQYQNF